MTIQINQEIYDECLFLSRLVYYDVEGLYPQPFDKFLTYEGKFTGLKMNIFDMGKYYIAVLCGTNGFKTTHTTRKVAGFRCCIVITIYSMLTCCAIVEKGLHKVIQVLITVGTQCTLILKLSQQLLDLIEVYTS